ncbi:mini-circle protein [Flexivirga endophytica]|uniref:Mini-circle protein n=1 Tax=Flexivirga endophytica TaxID=1849103 RepID=A0A916SWF8_9MICO|nr:DinB family protein [Flexivirga endophytica]GGB20881.1 mini-circle protein [Flexivirga endophytica]GHB58699.1 mini-circle protein [Flexivirga endophytica]
MTSVTDATPDPDATARVDPPVHANEIATLLGFLRYQRDTFRWKTGGLTSAGLAATLPPSDMTLGGMVKHLALVEAWWFHQVLHGADEPQPWASVDWDDDPDWEWRTGASDDPVPLAALYEESVAIADAGIERALAGDGFDALSIKPDRQTGEPFTLRWIVAHMIEEYARHNGHADLIRQSIDGRVGE